MAKRLLLIMNPAAGQKRSKRYLTDILLICRKYDFVPTVMPTAARGDATAIVKEYGFAADRIICVGGDGTLNEVISGILDAELHVPLGYIPAGSTNDFANSMKLPRNMLEAAQLACEGTPQAVDIGHFGDRYFSYVASFGAFTKASYSTPQNIKNALGHLAYLLEGIKDLPTIRPLHVRFDLPDKTLEGDYLFGAISNSTSVGGILTLDSRIVDMNDGKFEILLIKSPTNAMELNEIVVALTSQKYTSPALTFCTASRFTVHAPSSMDWTLDGEKEPGRSSFEVQNIHSAIQLII